MSKELKKYAGYYLILIVAYLYIKIGYYFPSNEYGFLEFLTLLSAALLPYFGFANKRIACCFVLFAYLSSFILKNKQTVVNDQVAWLTIYILLISIGLIIEKLQRMIKND